jgi:hypothetical protein
MPRRRAFVNFALGCCLFTAASGAAVPVLLIGAESPQRRQVENAFTPYRPFAAIRPRLRHPQQSDFFGYPTCDDDGLAE